MKKSVVQSRKSVSSDKLFASRDIRKNRVRKYISLKSDRRFVLKVFRSNKNMEAQIFDIEKSMTLFCASTLQKSLIEKYNLVKGSDINAAYKVGEALAEKALSLGVNSIVFDRGSYAYHGRVKAVADGARAAGLKF